MVICIDSDSDDDTQGHVSAKGAKKKKKTKPLVVRLETAAATSGWGDWEDSGWDNDEDSKANNQSSSKNSWDLQRDAVSSQSHVESGGLSDDGGWEDEGDSVGNDWGSRWGDAANVSSDADSDDRNNEDDMEKRVPSIPTATNPPNPAHTILPPTASTKKETAPPPSEPVFEPTVKTPSKGMGLSSLKKTGATAKTPTPTKNAEKIKEWDWEDATNEKNNISRKGENELGGAGTGGREKTSTLLAMDDEEISEAGWGDDWTEDPKPKNSDSKSTAPKSKGGWDDDWGWDGDR